MPDKIVASVVEGSGRFECLDVSHKGTPFVTSDLAEFEEHLKSGNHVKQGVEPCAICEKPVDMTGHPFMLKAICESCFGFYKNYFGGKK